MYGKSTTDLGPGVSYMFGKSTTYTRIPDLNLLVQVMDSELEDKPALLASIN